MLKKDTQIKLLEGTSYNGLLANLWRVILIKNGIDTEHKLEAIIASYLSYELIAKKLTSKKILTSSPSALKKEALNSNMPFKKFIDNLVKLFGIKKIRIKLETVDSLDKESTYEYEIDL